MKGNIWNNGTNEEIRFGVLGEDKDSHYHINVAPGRSEGGKTTFTPARNYIVCAWTSYGNGQLFPDNERHYSLAFQQIKGEEYIFLLNKDGLTKSLRDS